MWHLQCRNCPVETRPPDMGKKKWGTFLKNKCSKHGYQLGKKAKVLKGTNQIRQQAKRVSQASGNSPKEPLSSATEERNTWNTPGAVFYNSDTFPNVYLRSAFFFFFGNKYGLESVTSIGKRERINWGARSKKSWGLDNVRPLSLDEPKSAVAALLAKKWPHSLILPPVTKALESILGIRARGAERCQHVLGKHRQANHYLCIKLLKLKSKILKKQKWMERWGENSTVCKKKRQKKAKSKQKKKKAVWCLALELLELINR